MGALRSVPIGDLVRQVVEDVEGASDQLRDYRITVIDTARRQRIGYTVKARSYYCALMGAFDRHGISAVITVRPVATQPQKELPLCAA